MRINTFVECQWTGEGYEVVRSEGYEYTGEIAKCQNLFGGGASSTDRGYQLSSWQDLLSVFNNLAPTAENNINTAGNFFQSLLSGNPSTISSVLGPQISTLQSQGQQQAATNAQFNNRSGGTNAANQAISSNTRSNIDTLIGNLTGQAATGLGSLGLGALGVGTGSAAGVGSQAGGARSTDLQQSNLLGGAAGQGAGELLSLLLA